MRIFKNKWFARYARRSNIEDTVLCLAAEDANRGSLDADLGGGVVKQRIARPADGKSGGFRTIILFKMGELAFFVYGFAKSDRSNIDTDELKAFRKLALTMLDFDEQALTQAIEDGALMEIMCDEEAI